MRKIVLVCFSIVVTFGLAIFFRAEQAGANSEFYASGKCNTCHGPTNTCTGCHNMGTLSGIWTTTPNVTGTTNKKLYLPGETVSVRVAGGRTTGWARTLLFDENMVELDRNTGTIPTGYSAPCCGPVYYGPGYGMGTPLTAPAPPLPGTYTWNVAWYGSKYDLTEAGYLNRPNNFGPRWTPDPNNPNHGMELAYTNFFTVTTDVIPMINVAPTALAFGGVSMGISTTLLARVENVGTGDLVVTGITPCSGTSGEFTWSPSAPFSAASSTTGLYVTYQPIDAGIDSGCLIIASNDVAKPTVTITLSGTGQEAIDLDITKLTVPTSVSLRRKQTVTPALSVLNPGTRAGYANATILGIQNGIQVYNQSMSVYDAPGDAVATVNTFPAYSPTATGAITWTATISDQNPDSDTATATTTVNR